MRLLTCPETSGSLASLESRQVEQPAGGAEGADPRADLERGQQGREGGAGC